ncbi:hypothetical protein FEE96_05855 [Parasedimentitalea maritima]|uniref:Uncharacterized protein n=1 Tax=Parasedimentitalea maritima TaxID=2578117 RepID=A0ABY2UZJ7_9RHOB|nr:hypothetical protein FEE96_05855 [Zongyanglinia marina]
MSVKALCNLSLGLDLFRRMQSAKCQPNRLAHSRTVSRLTVTTRSGIHV